MRKPLKPVCLEVDAQGTPWLEGSQVGLAGALPGESLEALVGKRRKGVHPGWLTRVVRPHPHRLDPRCPHFGACGGCALQHLDYARQVALKAFPWERALAERGARILAPVPAPDPWYYRTKVELGFSPAGVPGFRRKGRFDQGVDIWECFIGPAENRAILAALRGWSAGRRGWNPRTLEGDLRYFVLRRSATSGQWLAVIVTSPGQAPTDLAAELMALGATGVVWAEQTSPAAAIVPDREELLAGSPVIEERLEDLRFSLSWRSFYQVNPPAYLKLLQTAREWVGTPGRLLDLCCGIGTIGLFLAPRSLVGVESVEPAVADARLNARRNGRGGEFHCALAQDFEPLECDLLVLDPPRSGCHPRLVKKLQERGPETILYVSCNPKLLLGELDAMPAYRLEQAQFFDFFPQTPHIEGLCLLRRL